MANRTHCDATEIVSATTSFCQLTRIAVGCAAFTTLFRCLTTCGVRVSYAGDDAGRQEA
ncbi:hypothetical protein [Rhizobium leguminosarum]|uniref:hypothetical protein n=1 Tax=Rhizobium leguminosarum TaxID=384 RepID=UPI003F9BBB5A